MRLRMPKAWNKHVAHSGVRSLKAAFKEALLEVGT